LEDFAEMRTDSQSVTRSLINDFNQHLTRFQERERIMKRSLKDFA